MRYILVITLFFTLSCKDESKIDKDLLSGDWVIESAVRDEKSTQTLDGLIFSFYEDELTSNVSGEMVSDTYTCRGNTISTSSSEIIYKVESIDSINLILSSTIRKSDFRFTFRRASDPH